MKRTPTLKSLLGEISAYRERAARLDRSLTVMEARLSTMLRQGMPGEVLDRLEDEIGTLRTERVLTDARMMNVVGRVRGVNSRRRYPADLDALLGKMIAPVAMARAG